MKYIGLADCNNFFASCERLFRPDLSGKPVVVLSSNDGNVVARSEEVKALGISMGVPYFKVKDILQENKVAVFSSNFDLYHEISNRVFETLERELGHVYQYSIDEVFFEMEFSDIETAEVELMRLKKLVQKHVGIPMSFGLAPTMTMAKYASKKEKRGAGVCVITNEIWQGINHDISIGELWGVGRSTADKMKANNISTVSDFLSKDKALIDKNFGLNGSRLWDELSGIPSKKFQFGSELPKSIMSSRSLAKETKFFSVIEEAIAFHVSKVAEDLRKNNLMARMLSVTITTNRHGDWLLRGGSNKCLLPNWTDDTRVLLDNARKLAKEIYESEVPYKKIGVVVSDIKSNEFKQLMIFESEPTEVESKNSLMKVIDSLNSKIGIDAVTIGRLKYKSGWSNRRDFKSPNYVSSWSELPKVGGR